MDYARQQRDPTKHAIGIAFVVADARAAHLGAADRARARGRRGDQEAAVPRRSSRRSSAPPPPPPPPKKIVEAPKAAGAGRDLRSAARHSGPDDAGARDLGRYGSAAAARAVRDCPTGSRVAPPRRHRRSRRSARTRSAKAGEDLVYPRAAIRAGVDKGHVVARINDRRKGQRHGRHHPVRRPAAESSIARSSTGSRNGNTPPKAKSTSPRSRSTFS